MRFKQLGRSGLVVSDLCLGTMIFGEESVRGTAAGEAEQMIHRFLDAPEGIRKRLSERRFKQKGIRWC